MKCLTCEMEIILGYSCSQQRCHLCHTSCCTTVARNDRHHVRAISHMIRREHLKVWRARRKKVSK